MRTLVALVIASTALATPVAAQELPVGGNQSIDMATLVRLLSPVIQSLGGAQSTSLDGLSLNNQAGAGDITQFSQIFKSVGYDGEMNSLLSQLEGLKGVDFGSLAKMAARTPGPAAPGGSPAALPGMPARSGPAAIQILSGLSETSGASPSTAGSVSGAALPFSAASLSGLMTSGPSTPVSVGLGQLPASSSSIRRSIETIDGKTLPKYSNVPTAPAK